MEPSHNNRIGISIGWNCHSASQGVDDRIRPRRGRTGNMYNTCPFDIMLSNFDGVVECIKDDFAYFTDEIYLTLDARTNQSNPCIINRKYRFAFPHESPQYLNLHERHQWSDGKNHFMVDNYRNFKERYNRRIQNFRNYLRDPTNHVIFLLTTWEKTEQDLQPLHDALNARYPDLSYEIKLYNNPSGKENFIKHLRFMGYSENDNELKRLLPSMETSSLTALPNKMKDTKLNFIIGLHMIHESGGGGSVVQHYLARLLQCRGYEVRMANAWTDPPQLAEPNAFFGNSIIEQLADIDPQDDNTIVIYCEGVKGNPLNGKRVVRWMLSELGKNVPARIAESWGDNEVVYYFNEEPKITHAPKANVNTIYKYLTLPLFDDKVQKLSTYERVSSFYCVRKAYCYHTNMHQMHPPESSHIEFTNKIDFALASFNFFKIGYFYDPLSMLALIAPACGCMAVVHPLHGKTRQEWLNTICFGRYIRENVHDEGDIYGIAYDNTPDQMRFAEETLHLAPQQWLHMKAFFGNDIEPFLEDMHHFDSLPNRKYNNFV